jgi:AhpD family alkylhydroperoxidase
LQRRIYLGTSRGATEKIARGVGKGRTFMSRTAVESDIRKTLGLVPEFLTEIPDTMIEAEWASFKEFELAETVIPNKYKELIGLAVSGATRCAYCAYFHTEAAKLFGATDEEINEAALMAKHTMGWSTYLNTLLVDEDEFRAEFEQIAAYVRSQSEAAAPA